MEYLFPGFTRIVISPDICTGKPRIRGTRISVASILAYLAGGMSIEELLKEFHWISKDDILESLAFSSMMLNDQLIPLEKAA